jgi:prolyl-tRNA editing enzyme YbaK/EbsC (Cys-tRNA(Pro) deacylase)
VAATAEPDPRVGRALAELGIAHEVLPCDPEVADTAAFCARYGFPPERSLNTIVVASKREPRSFAACVVQATARLDVNHRVRGLMGVSRLSFASPEETTQLTGMLVGGVTPFGLPEGWPIYVDERALPLDWVILGGGNRSSKLRLHPRELLRIPGAQAVRALTQS